VRAPNEYVAKPYSAHELIAGIRAVLRRGDDDSEISEGVLESGRSGWMSSAAPCRPTVT
jgi:DNA-binding response OmpR family regulator